VATITTAATDTTGSGILKCRREAGAPVVNEQVNEARTMADIENYRVADTEGTSAKAIENNALEMPSPSELLYDDYLKIMNDRQAVAQRPQDSGKPNSDQGKNNDGMKVLNEGRIMSLDLPQGWQPEKPQPAWENVSETRAFNPPNSPDTRLALFDRRVPLSNQSAEHLRGLLAKPDHTVFAKGADASALNPLKEVLGNMTDQNVFDLRKVSTKTVNGQTALVVEGQWKGEGGKQYVGVIIPKDASAKETQEVFFSAKPADFNTYAAAANKAISSIVWKPQANANREGRPQ